MSLFSGLEVGLPVETELLGLQFKQDPYPKKVLLGAGVYYDDKGEFWTLPVVRKAEKAIANDETLNKSYLPLLGLPEFIEHALNLLLGADSPALKENRVFGCQSISGTGSLRLGAEFLSHVCRKTIFYFSDPSWAGHCTIFSNAGFREARQYRYWDPKTKGLDFNGLIEDLENAPEGAVIILQACAHNPTGCDLTHEQWKKVAEVIKRQKLIPFFDSAYQGFATGDIVRDAWAVRYFVSQGFELFCAQSFSKNMGLYNERAGNLTVVMQNPQDLMALQTHMRNMVRGIYLNAPNHACRVVTHIFNDRSLYSEWMQCLTVMSSRILNMRKRLREELEKLDTPGKWNHITDQIGMFSYTGLNEEQSLNMLNKYHVYMLKSGRISVSGLNNDNVAYVANAIQETLRDFPSI